MLAHAVCPALPWPALPGGGALLEGAPPPPGALPAGTHWQVPSKQPHLFCDDIVAARKRGVKELDPTLLTCLTLPRPGTFQRACQSGELN